MTNASHYNIKYMKIYFNNKIKFTRKNRPSATYMCVLYPMWHRMVKKNEIKYVKNGILLPYANETNKRLIPHMTDAHVHSILTDSSCYFSLTLSLPLSVLSI